MCKCYMQHTEKNKLWTTSSCLSFFISLFIFLFIAVLHLCCWVGFSLLAASRGYSGCSTQAFSCGGARVLGCVGFSSRSTQTQWLWLLGSGTWTQCGARAQMLCSMWDLPRPGIRPVSPALAGGCFTTEPSGKPSPVFYCVYFGFHQVVIGKLYTDSTIKFIIFKCLFI